MARAKDELQYWQYVYKLQLEKASDSGDRAYLTQLQQGYFMQNRPIQEQLYILQELSSIAKRFDPEMAAKLEKEFKDAQASFVKDMPRS